MIEEIKKFLGEKNIAVPEEWIPACLEFIKAENGCNVGSAGWMKSKVLEQWLHADIRDLASCCLPFGISTEKLATITGQFPLQVNSVKDVGLPAYSQLQKLKKSDIQNENVSAEVSHKAAWEPKPSRMLFLELTDGTNFVHGMEYAFIPCLSLALKPGIKILVKGNIEVRKGVLFLTKENVSLLGGEVESLLVPNALENVLNKALGLDLTNAPTKIPDECLHLEQSQLSSSTVPSQYYPTQSSQLTQKLNCNLKRTSSNWPKPVSNSAFVSSSIKRKVPASNELDDLDDFFDDETELALLAVERKMNNVSQTNHSLLPKSNTYQTNSQSTSRNTFSNFHDFSKTKSQDKMPLHNESSTNLDSSESKNSSDINNVKQNNVNSANIPKCNLPPQTENVDNFNDSLELDDDILLAAEINVCSQFKSDLQTGKNSANNVKSQNTLSSVPKKLKQSKITNFSMPVREKFGGTSDNESSYPSRKLNNKFIVQEKNIAINRNTSSIIDTSGINQIPNWSKPQRSLLVSSQNDENTYKRKRLTHNYEIKAEEMGVQNRFEEINLEQKLREMPLPFQYLCMINLNPLQKTFYIIKGFVLTLISKLEREQGKWCLKAKINDGTGSCDVVIHNDILCGLIGMSVQEFNLKKNEAKSNPALRSQMSQMINNCQRELISMSCLLRLEVGPNLPLPVVTELIPLTNSHCRQLQSRS